MHAPLNRRLFLKASAVLGSALGVGGTLVFSLGCKTRGPWRSFSESEARLLEALCEQIIPGDQDPGAREAGVLYFIDRQLQGPYRRFLEAYHHGLGALQQTSRTLYGRDFLQLTWEEQNTFLHSLEEGRIPAAAWTLEPAAVFFARVVDHAMQGFYGSPRHGGNRRFVSWRMLKLDQPPILGQNRYR